MDKLEINAEIITAVLSVIGGVILIIFKLMGIPISSLNFFKKDGKEETTTGKNKILEDMEQLLKNESSKYISKIGRVIQFCEIVKPQVSDQFNEYIKSWIQISRHSNVAYGKLTLDCTRIKIFNSLFIGAISSAILSVKRENGLKLLILLERNSRLHDLMGNFETLKEDSTSIELKVIKDYRE